ncbi:accessory gene regulator B family protein [uncultured Clostridium sp.]|uniref:accessory gene regulator ArgB-like protein n=1 Tax=uncultured Clostridium sp. TaxID=59620 RepID=UPI0028E658F9|nr:accessory gene regulator B family protein [uncultured Clostridium sp.]
MRKVIKIIAEYIARTNKYTKEQEEQIEYALRVSVFEIMKIIGTIIVFALMGYTFEAIIAMATMVLTKPYIGGYHEDTQLKCFISTLIIIGSIIYLSINLNVDFISKIILNGTSFYCIFHQVPIINPNMPLTRPELVKRNRTVGIIMTTIFILISIIFYKNTLISNTILWTVVFQALLMFNKRNIK